MVLESTGTWDRGADIVLQHMGDEPGTLQGAFLQKLSVACGPGAPVRPSADVPRSRSEFSFVPV